jgi:hypothetical protein
MEGEGEVRKAESRSRGPGVAPKVKKRRHGERTGISAGNPRVREALSRENRYPVAPRKTLTHTHTHQ